MDYKIQRDWRTDEITGILKVIDEVPVLAIPVDENNTDYANYLEWVADGNTASEVGGDKATRDANRLNEEWTIIRQQRDRLLTESDWTHGGDSPLSASNKTKWETYRQELRDIPTDQSSEIAASDITWPDKP